LTSISNSQDTLATQFGPAVLEASSVGRTAYSRLKEGEKGTVQGVFSSAINIFFAGGLVSLVPEEVQEGPLNVTLRLTVGVSGMSCLGASDGDNVTVHDFAFKIGNRRVVSFGSARIYSPRRKFALPMLESDEVEANVEVVRKTALHFGNMAGLGELLTLITPRGVERTPKSLNIFASAALDRIIRFEQAFRSQKKTGLTHAVRDLIGLGPGLTPSSDDMLAGLVLLRVLYATNYGCKKRPSQLLPQVIAEEVSGRTTVISEEFLRQAALGNGNEPVMRLCEALLTGGRDLAERETRRVLAIGETSGTDTVLGILLGTMLSMGKRSGLEMRERT